MSATIKSAAGQKILRQPNRVRWSRGMGSALEVSYDGSTDAILGMIAGFKNSADEITVDIDGPSARITALKNGVLAESGEVEEPAEVWEMPGKTEDVSLTEHPDVVALNVAEPVTGKPWALCNLMQKAYDNHWTKVEYVDALLNQVGRVIPGGQVANYDACVAWLDMAARGISAFRTKKFTLRRTLTFSGIYDYTGILADAYAGVEGIYTTATLLTNYGEGMQPGMAAAAGIVGDVAYTGMTAPANYAYGWLKGEPNLGQVGFEKLQLSQEWELDFWSTMIYGAAL